MTAASRLFFALHNENENAKNSGEQTVRIFSISLHVNKM